MLLAHPMVDPAARKVLSGQPDVQEEGSRRCSGGQEVDQVW